MAIIVSKALGGGSNKPKAAESLDEAMSMAQMMGAKVLG